MTNVKADRHGSPTMYVKHPKAVSDTSSLKSVPMHTKHTKAISETSSIESAPPKYSMVMGIGASAISPADHVLARSSIRPALYSTIGFSTITVVLSAIECANSWEGFNAGIILPIVFCPLQVVFATSLITLLRRLMANNTVRGSMLPTSRDISIASAIILASGWAATLAMWGISMRDLGNDMLVPWNQRSRAELVIRCVVGATMLLSLVVQVFLVFKMVAERRLWKAAQRSASYA